MSLYIHGAIALGALAVGLTACREQEGKKTGSSDPTFKPDEPSSSGGTIEGTEDSGIIDSEELSPFVETEGILTATSGAPMVVDTFDFQGNNMAAFFCYDPAVDFSVDSNPAQKLCYVTKFDGSYYSGPAVFGINMLDGTIGGFTEKVLNTLEAPQNYDINKAKSVVVGSEPYTLLAVNSFSSDTAMEANSDYTDGLDSFNATGQDGTQHGLLILDRDAHQIGYINLYNRSMDIGGRSIPITGVGDFTLDPTTGDLWIVANNYASGMAELEGNRGVNYGSSVLVRVSNWLDETTREYEEILLDGVYNANLLSWDDTTHSLIVGATEGTRDQTNQSVFFRYSPETRKTSEPLYLESGLSFSNSEYEDEIYVAGAESQQRVSVIDPSSNEIEVFSIPDNDQTFLSGIAPWQGGLLLTQQAETSSTTVDAQLLWCGAECSVVDSVNPANFVLPPVVLENSSYSEDPIAIFPLSQTTRTGDTTTYPWGSTLKVMR